jgi:pimeloyl-ACP methyl ester carboxylesterase/DNA-binding CsgD family transcriptional regulator
VGTPGQRFFRTDVGGRAVAWSAVGSGPPLIFGGWWCSHLELDWQNGLFRDFIAKIAEHRTVIRYDRPGMGLSEPSPDSAVTLLGEVAILAAIADAVSDEFASTAVDMLGASSGGPVVACYATQRPERVRSLALYGSYVRGAEIADAAARDAIVALIAEHWGVASKFLADVFLPDATADERRDFVEFQRAAATAETASAALNGVYRFDATQYLSDVTAPTLVLHRRQDRAMPFALGRKLAAAISGARFVALNGLDHYPWRGDSDAVASALLDFLGVDARPATPVRAELSGREREVVALIAQGMTDQEIADLLVLSAHTVHRHVANIRSKLGVTSRAAAAAAAIRAGLA